MGCGPLPCSKNHISTHGRGNRIATHTSQIMNDTAVSISRGPDTQRAASSRRRKLNRPATKSSQTKTRNDSRKLELSRHPWVLRHTKLSNPIFAPLSIHVDTTARKILQSRCSVQDPTFVNVPRLFFCPSFECCVHLFPSPRFPHIRTLPRAIPPLRSPRAQCHRAL